MYIYIYIYIYIFNAIIHSMDALPRGTRDAGHRVDSASISAPRDSVSCCYAQLYSGSDIAYREEDLDLLFDTIVALGATCT